MKQALVGIVLGMTLAACAHTQTVETSSSQQPTPTRWVEPEVTTEAAPPPTVEVSQARPRLSQTVTLGQGSEAAYVPSAPPRAAAEGNQSVVVNNTVIVQNGGGYGYPVYRGGYGGYGTAHGRVADGRASNPSQGTSMWSTTGWEGARRTAAPGQTPGVGGNWSPPPSYGPAQMK